MATQAIDGAALRQMVNIAKKQSINFAFCPGSKKDDVLLLDKRTPAAVLAKEAKKIGSTPKTAFGQMSADATEINLICESPLPNLAKSIRKYLKDNGVSAKVQLVDGDGSVLEQEGEAEAPKDAPEPQAEDSKPTAPGIDKTAQTNLSKELKDTLIKAARGGPDLMAMASKAAKSIASQIKDNDLGAARQALSDLAAQVQKPAASTPDAAEEEQSVLDLATVRRDWASARKMAAADVRALVAGVAQATSDADGLGHASGEMARLVHPIKQLDTKLDTLLAQMEKAASADERNKLASAARRQISQHVGLMNTEFFKAVDQSGFANTTIRATVLGSLRKVNKALGG